MMNDAPCEASLATLGCGLLDRRRFRSRAEARMAVFAFIEGRYAPRRRRRSALGARRSALGYPSPVEYERRTRTSA
jgi:putative transposase